MYLSGKAHHRMLKLHLQYGDIVRVAPNQLAFLQPDAWQEIMGHRKSNENENGKSPSFYRDGNLNVIGSDRKVHTQQRRLLSHGFSQHAMLQQQPVIGQYISLLIQQLREYSKDGSEPVDIVRWLNFTTFDIIGDLAVGEPFGSLKNGKYHAWVALIFDSVKAGALAYIIHDFTLLRNGLSLLIPKDMKQKVADRRELTQRLVEKRLAVATDRLDFMHAMTRKHAPIVGLMTPFVCFLLLWLIGFFVI